MSEELRKIVAKLEALNLKWSPEGGLEYWDNSPIWKFEFEKKTEEGIFYGYLMEGNIKNNEEMILSISLRPPKEHPVKLHFKRYQKNKEGEADDFKFLMNYLHDLFKAEKERARIYRNKFLGQ